MKTVRVRMSERCFRFKPEALPNHAPPVPGVYEFVTFDDARQAKVVYVGLALGETILQCLTEHLEGRREPTAQKLLSRYPNMYFDYIAQATLASPEEWRDVAEALLVKHRPELNGPPPTQAKVELKEVEIL